MIITYILLSSIFWTINYIACTMNQGPNHQTSFIEAFVIAAFAVCGWMILFFVL